MGGDKKQERAREEAEAERQRAQAAAEAERVRGKKAKAEAKEISALTPLEQESIERGFGLEESLAGLALDPERQVAMGQMGTEGLVNLLTQQALENVVTPTFQRRGLTTSGIAVEAGSRAAIEQALGVSQLVLQQAQQRSQFLQGVTADIAGRGQVARGREISGGLQGLGLERQAQAGALGAQTGGLQRGYGLEQTALAQPSTAQQWGQGIGQVATTGAMLAMMTNPATAGLSPALALATQSPLQQAGGALGYNPYRQPIPRLV
jgi:hypothetical protein